MGHLPHPGASLWLLVNGPFPSGTDLSGFPCWPGLRLELCSQAGMISFRTALGCRGFVDWQDGWNGKTLPTWSPLFFLDLAPKLSSPGILWDNSLPISPSRALYEVCISVFTWRLFLRLLFFLSPWCLLRLLDQNISPLDVGTISSNSSFLFSTIPFLIPCVLKAFIKVYFDMQRVGHDGVTEQPTGLFTEWLWGKVVVRWSFHFVKILARHWPFSVPHLINIKNNHKDAFSNVLWN